MCKMERGRKNFAAYFLSVLIGLNVLAYLAVYELRGQGLEVIYFDVGQGDGIFIETPQKHQILIDGGPNSTILEKLGKEMPFWDRTIDLIILTHPEKDHMSGLIEVLKRYKVGNVLWTGIVRDTQEFKEWEKALGKEKTNVKTAKAGQTILCSTSDVEHCYFEILYPFENLEGREFENSNDTSIVNRLVFGQSSFLFTGDISKSVEKEIAARINPLSDILKISHHGSKTSTAEEFIRAVLPQVAVVSSGRDNRYGHPHQEVLETLASYDIKVLRTDELGDIKIISDGKLLRIKNAGAR